MTPAPPTLAGAELAAEWVHPGGPDPTPTPTPTPSPSPTPTPYPNPNPNQNPNPNPSPNPSEPWPVIKYIVTLNRASYYYTLSYVMPGILITMLSFAVYYGEQHLAPPRAPTLTLCKPSPPP
jgi:hypothetical protein